MSTDADLVREALEFGTRIAPHATDNQFAGALPALDRLEARIEELEKHIKAAEWAMTKHAEWYRASEARCERLEGVLQKVLMLSPIQGEAYQIIESALLDPYADVPGAGQRGC